MQQNRAEPNGIRPLLSPRLMAAHIDYPFILTLTAHTNNHHQKLTLSLHVLSENWQPFIIRTIKSRTIKKETKWTKNRNSKYKRFLPHTSN